MPVGRAAYHADHDSWIPGLNTSGQNLQFPEYGGTDRGGFANTIDEEGYTAADASRPVQATDWISPTIGAEFLPKARTERFTYILDSFADPTRVASGPPFETGQASSGMREYLDEIKGEAVALLPSYFMSNVFQFFGSSFEGRAETVTATGDIANLAIGPADLPSGYSPRVTAIGNLSLKVMCANGTRFIADDGSLDFNSEYNRGAATAFRGSSFTDMPGSSARSHSWSDVRAPLEVREDLTYRHNDRINAAFWDGSVRQLTKEESRDPKLWYPSRSVWVGDVSAPSPGQSGVQMLNNNTASRAPNEDAAGYEYRIDDKLP